LVKVREYLENFILTKENKTPELISDINKETLTDYIDIGRDKVKRYINEFWTSKQRQASSIHEVSYRACFKPQLPRFFIKLLTNEKDIVYDPFAGRGTTPIEAGLIGRNIIFNDINPISNVFTIPRLFIPTLEEVKERLNIIDIDERVKADIDLSMFYHPRTESELVSLKLYLLDRKGNGKEDYIDRWIRMVATNRLTGHSAGFFSVYTLPPNQAVSQESQIKINEKRKQKPEYKDVKAIILKKTKSLLRNITSKQINNLKRAYQHGLFLNTDSRNTYEIPDESVQLTVTSPPFLNIVQYSKDNWLRCWFNSIDDKKITENITMAKTIDEWNDVMGDVFTELFRITKEGGWVAFEVGEVKNGKIKLDEYVVPLGLKAGFDCEGIVINLQEFTKTSKIWGVGNNKKGTNTNRIVIFKKN
jgi:hypothetical protein